VLDPVPRCYPLRFDSAATISTRWAQLRVGAAPRRTSSQHAARRGPLKARRGPVLRRLALVAKAEPGRGRLALAAPAARSRACIRCRVGWPADAGRRPAARHEKFSIPRSFRDRAGAPGSCDRPMPMPAPEPRRSDLVQCATAPKCRPVPGAMGQVTGRREPITWPGSLPVRSAPHPIQPPRPFADGENESTSREGRRGRTFSWHVVQLRAWGLVSSGPL